MEYWLRMAKNLSYGAHDKIQCCATDQSMRIEHNSKGYRGYCFRCKKSVYDDHGELSLAELSARRDAVQAMMHDKVIRLPNDIVPVREGDAAAWLLRAGVSLSIADRYGFGYSPRLDRVVLPVYKEGTLVAYTMRSTKEKPKYIERQVDETAIHYSLIETILEPEQAPDYGLDLVVTEDILSCVRVGRIVRSAALLGTAVSPAKVGSLVDGYKAVRHAQGIGTQDDHLRIGVWLDADKAGIQARKRLATRLSLYGHEAILIKTDKDPKRYSNREIRSILRDRCNSVEASQEQEGLRSTYTDAIGEGG